MASYSTRETAKLLGLHYTTLHRYIRAKKVPVPFLSRVGGVRVRLWSEADVERVRKLLPTLPDGRSTRHVKTKKGTKKQPAPKRSKP